MLTIYRQKQPLVVDSKMDIFAIWPLYRLKLGPKGEIAKRGMQLGKENK
jgi:hypothetical protein